MTNTQVKCLTDDCGRPGAIKGRCKSHHWSWYRKQETDDPDRQCQVQECRRVRVAKGRCHTHYTNWKHQRQRQAGKAALILEGRTH